MRSLQYLGAAVMAAAVLLAGPVGAKEFAHDAHNNNADIKDCSVCHKAEAKSIVPAQSACLDCHKQEELADFQYGKLKTHGPFWVGEHELDARKATAKCDRCHEQKFCLECHKGDPKIHRPGNHIAGFLEVHPIRARGNEDACRKCHETSFCVDCHKRFDGDDLKVLSHRKGWSNLRTGAVGPQHQTFPPSSCETCHPGGILTSHDWTNGHAREARRNLTSCQSCHPQGDVCKKCHSAVEGLKANPHPKNWDDKHKRLAGASDEKSCRACHLKKSQDPTCSRCH